jgi:hypothetical protein
MSALAARRFLHRNQTDCANRSTPIASAYPIDFANQLDAIDCHH